jgi:hypothetical protein
MSSFLSEQTSLEHQSDPLKWNSNCNKPTYELSLLREISGSHSGKYEDDDSLLA